MKKGAKVYWTDPDDGLCSGYYTVESHKGEIVTLADGQGGTCEALESECTEALAGGYDGNVGH